MGEKHYKVNATTVSDVCKQIFQKSGISQDNQAVSFRGRLLRPSDKLSDVGISVGDTINIMKRRKEALSGTPLSAGQFRNGLHISSHGTSVAHS